MPKPPQPLPVDPAELRDLALATMRRARFPMLATMDGDQPRVRPVSPVHSEGFTVYIANLRSYAKTAQLAANAKAELCYLDEDHHQVRITARVSVLSAAGLLSAIWNGNPLLRSYLGQIDNPELIVYRCEPIEVRYMREWALHYHPIVLP